MDYLRHARQIALAEIGPEGQPKLARTPVDLSAFDAVARELHERAGGAVSPDASLVIDAPARVSSRATEALGLAAWASIEAARRVMGEAPREVSPGLIERLSLR